jgi:hypothetical protein
MSEGQTCYEQDEDLCTNPMCARVGCVLLNQRLTKEKTLPHPDLLAATVSCTGTTITIECNDHAVKDHLMNWLTGA